MHEEACTKTRQELLHGLARLLLTVSLCSSRREVQSGVEFVFDRALVADR